MERNFNATILYVSKNFRKKLSLEELAKTSGLSLFHFQRKFVERYNCSPQKYLEKIRMQHATHIISAFPNWSITQVAFESGYSSPGIFTRAFKNYFGIPPSKYKPQNEITEVNLNLDDNPKIQYLSSKNILVQKSLLLNPNLNKAIRNILELKKSTKTIYGFFLDIPFHVPIPECRYYLGTETTQNNNDDSILTFPSGYYTSITIEGDFDQLKETVFGLNQKIQAKGYVIDSIIGYEKIHIEQNVLPLNYMRSTRELFMKIKRE